MVAVSVISLVLGLLLLWKGRAHKTTAVLALIAGAGMTGGFVGSMFQTGLGWLSDMAAALTSSAFGAAVPAILGIIALFIVIHDLWPGHTAGRITAVAALALPVLTTGIAGAVGSASTQAIDALRSGAMQAFSTLFGV